MSLDVTLIEDDAVVYSANITHNLTNMAAEADIYNCLWRPDENGMTKARHMIRPLRDGVERLVSRPSYFETLNASNGWGKWENFLPFCAKYLEACVEHPEADIHVSR